MKDLSEYEQILLDATEDIKLTGVSIQEACKFHPSLYLYYYDKYCELKAISDYTQIEVDKVQAECTIKLNEHHQIDLGSVLINKYINAEPEYIKIKQLLSEVNEIKSKFEGVIQAFISRGYNLKNITELRVKEIEDGVL